jgi:hypothetical protein
MARAALLLALLLLAVPLAAQDRYLAANVGIHAVGAVTRALVEHRPAVE